MDLEEASRRGPPHKRLAVSNNGDWYRGASAIFIRDALTFASYRTQLITQNFSIVFSLALFYYLSKLVSVSAFGSPTEYFSYVVIGLVILQVVQSGFSAPATIRTELVAGTFERMVVSPFGPTGSILALLLFPFASSLVVGLITVLISAACFGLDVQWSTAAAAIPVAVLGALSFVPFALAFAAITVRFKQTPGIAYVMAAISLVSGLYFPVSLLPPWLSWAAEVQPFTPATELLRHVLIGLPTTESVWLLLAKLFAFTAVLLPAGIWTVVRAIEASRRHGTIVEY